MTKYEILGVDRTATVAQLRSAYRKLALKLHPDRNPGDKAKETRFKEISAAYTTLSDPRQREVYDRELDRPTPRPTAGSKRHTPGPVYAQAESFYRDRHNRRRKRQPQAPAYTSEPMELGKVYPVRPGPVLGASIPLSPGQMPGQIPMVPGGIPIVPMWNPRKKKNP